MTEQDIKQQLSLAYVGAIAAQAGLIFRNKTGIDYGMDGDITCTKIRIESNGKKRFSDSGFRIDFQIKATTNIIPKNGYLIYNLESKNYNDLVDTQVGAQRILIVYLLPKNQDEWVKVEDKQMIIKNCAWWCSLKGLEYTTNTRTKTIKIPEKNLLTVEELKRLMSCVNEGVEL